MILKIPADHRHYNDHGWLKTYHLFSFADYYDPNNLAFGNVRVFNDDTIAGETGFGAHSHDNMEIVTIVHEGTLTHQDSMGNTGTISSGEVQYMSAGTGVTHAEENLRKETVKLYQIWILPRSQGLTPKYEQKDFTEIAPANQLVPLASGFNHAGAIVIEANAAIFNAHLNIDSEFDHVIQENRGALVYVQKGTLTINGVEFSTGDQARITDENLIAFIAQADCHFVLIETELS